MEGYHRAHFIHNHSKFHIPPYAHRDQELQIELPVHSQ